MPSSPRAWLILTIRWLFCRDCSDIWWRNPSDQWRHPAGKPCQLTLFLSHLQSPFSKAGGTMFRYVTSYNHSSRKMFTPVFPCRLGKAFVALYFLLISFPCQIFVQQPFFWLIIHFMIAKNSLLLTILGRFHPASLTLFWARTFFSFALSPPRFLCKILLLDRLVLITAIPWIFDHGIFFLT